MSSFLGEMVFSMPPVSMAALEVLAEQVLLAVAPEMLARPMSLDVLELVDHTLPKVLGIHVTPVHEDEISGMYGATDPKQHGGTEIDVLIRKEVWTRLLEGGKRANHARATVIHEVSHAVLHVPIIRRRMRSPNKELLLARYERQDLPAYREPEWQAWALAGSILMPRKALMMLRPRSFTDMAEVFGVSEQFTKQHARRLKFSFEGGTMAT